MTGAAMESNDSYTTPLLYQSDRGWQVIIMGGTQLDGYDPRSGQRLWNLSDLGGNRTITSPTLSGDTVYATVGMKGPLLAVRLGGQGELARDAIVWQHEKGTSDTPCTVVWENLIFLISDNGVCRCLDRSSGQTKWTQRLPGEYRASPVAVAGRIYLLNREGFCTVLAATAEYKKLSANQLDDKFFASPAISDGRFYLRGKQTLYCVAGADSTNGTVP